MTIQEILATPEFQNLTDAEASQALAEKTAVVNLTEEDRSTWVTDRSLAGLFGYARAAVILASAEVASQIVDGMSDEQKGMALALGMVLRQLKNQAGDPPGLSIASPQAPTLLATLVAVGLITQAEADTLAAKAVKTVSWYEANGISPVHSGDIAALRGGM